VVVGEALGAAGVLIGASVAVEWRPGSALGAAGVVNATAAAAKWRRGSSRASSNRENRCFPSATLEWRGGR